MLLSAMLSPHLFIFFSLSLESIGHLFPNNYVFSFPFFPDQFPYILILMTFLPVLLKFFPSHFFVAQHLKFQPNITLSIHFLLYSEESVVRFYYKLKILKIIFLNNYYIFSHFQHFHLILSLISIQFSFHLLLLFKISFLERFIYTHPLFFFQLDSVSTHSLLIFILIISKNIIPKSSKDFRTLNPVNIFQSVSYFSFSNIKTSALFFLETFLFGFHDKSSLSQNFCSYLLVILFYVAFNLTSSHYCLSSHSLS